MHRTLLLCSIALYVCACGGQSTSDSGGGGGGTSAGGAAGNSGSGGASSGGTSSGGASSGGASSGGASSGGASSGGSGGSSSGGGAGAPPGNCKAEPVQDAQCAGKPPHFYACFNGTPYPAPAGCVNIYIGNATDFWCCP